MKKPKVIIIVGPTASGKTALSIQIAKKFGGEVISADSRQVYRGLDIGTEKITHDEMDAIPHHLLDVADVDTVYSAADFRRDADAAIIEIVERGKTPVIAGGTFFYIDMLLRRVNPPEVAPDPALRAHLEDMSAETLFRSLEQLDPERAFAIDRHNKRRLIRALEIIQTEGKVPVSEPEECPYDVLMLGIATDREELRIRIRNRAQDALTKGLVEETKKLLASGVSKDRLSEIGLEYRVIMEYIDGELTEEALIQKLEEKNWQYAKRQLLWLKQNDSIVWVNHDNSDAIFGLVEAFIHP